jgi:RimJ/RimL family protein N-acetyltransferase
MQSCFVDIPVKMDMDNAFRSANLIYRAIEDNDEDKAFIHDKINSDPIIGAQMATASSPARKKGTQDQVKYLSTDALLGVMICLPADPTTEASAAAAHAAPTPIGLVNLGAPRKGALWNRNTTVGIAIARAYQGKGYGSEALNWVVDWAFVFGGMNKVGIGCASFNPGAERLYKRLGFVEEGRIRHDFWFKGEFHDRIELGMLEDEWRKLRSNKKDAK